METLRLGSWFLITGSPCATTCAILVGYTAIFTGPSRMGRLKNTCITRSTHSFMTSLVHGELGLKQRLIDSRVSRFLGCQKTMCVSIHSIKSGASA